MHLKKQQIIYSILMLTFLTILTLFLVSRYVPDNFIQVFFDDRFGDGFYFNLVDTFIIPFIIYIAIGIVLLWLWARVIHALENRISASLSASYAP